MLARHRSKLMVAIISYAVGAGTAWAQEVPAGGQGGVPPEAFDCTQVTVEFTDDPTLTAQEKMQRMDQALMRSLARFDACRNAQASAGGGGGQAGGAGGGGMTGGQGGAGGNSGTAGSASSHASTEMIGTEPPPEAQPAPELAAPQGEASGDAAMASAPDRPQAADNGKAPEDIPAADNDSVLEAQIRQAAMNETNPKVREKLWNEYRKYKGLPPAN